MRRRHRAGVAAALLGVLAACWTGTAGVAAGPIYLPFLRQLEPLPPLPEGEVARWVGAIGGGASELALGEKAAYLGQGYRLITVDLSDVGHPRRAGELALLGGFIRDVAVAGDKVYVAAGAGGLTVLDLADPLAPRPLGALDTPGDAHAIAVDGSVAYLADGPAGLRVVDLSDPRAPREVGALDTILAAQCVSVHDGLVLVGIAEPRSRGLLVIDVSDPARPVEVGALATADEPTSIALRGGLAYVAAGMAGLLVVDVSDPRRPRLVARVLDGARAVSLWEGMAFVIADGLRKDAGLHVLDLADPAAPEPVESIAMRGLSDLAVDDGRLYLAGAAAGLTVHAGEGTTGWRPFAYLDDPGLVADHVAVSARLAYVTSPGLMRVVDISDPARPRAIGHAGMTGLDVRGVAASGDHVYLSLTSGQVQIIDVRRPAAPRVATRFNPGVGGQISAMAIAGRYGLMTVGSPAQLLVVDLSLPEWPRVEGRVDIAVRGDAVAGWGTRAYLSSSGDARLDAFDIMDPARPRLWGSVGHLAGELVFAVGERFAYVADRGGDFGIVDVSDPERMTQVGRLALPFSLRHVGAAGSFAFLASGDAGLQVVDVATPSAPRLGAVLDTPGDAAEVALANGYAYVADGTGGLQIFRMATP